MHIPATPPREPKIHRFEIAPRTIIHVLIAVAVVWILLQLWVIGLLLIVTLVFVGTLNPIAEGLEQRGIPRRRALLLIFSSIAVIAMVLLTLIVPALIEQVMQIAQDAPGHKARLVVVLEQQPQTAALAVMLQEFDLKRLSTGIREWLMGHSMNAIEVIGYLVTTLFLAYYLLADGKRTQGALYALVPRDYHMRLARILHNLEVIVGGYVRGQLITSAVITVFTYLLLVACGVPNPLALALFAGLADVIPFVGGFLATAPAVLAALPRGTPVTIIVFTALCVYQEFENRILVPRVYGHVLRLSPAVVVVALLVGGMLLGIIGALLALPIAAGLRMIISELRVDMPGDDSHDPKESAQYARTQAVYEKRSQGSTAPEAGQIATELAQDIREEDKATAARGGRQS